MSLSEEMDEFHAWAIELVGRVPDGSLRSDSHADGRTQYVRGFTSWVMLESEVGALDKLMMPSSADNRFFVFDGEYETVVVARLRKPEGGLAMRTHKLTTTDTKAANYTAKVGELVRFNPLAGPFTITAPATAFPDDQFGVMPDYDAGIDYGAAFAAADDAETRVTLAGIANPLPDAESATELYPIATTYFQFINGAWRPLT